MENFRFKQDVQIEAETLAAFIAANLQYDEILEFFMLVDKYVDDGPFTAKVARAFTAEALSWAEGLGG